MGQFLRQEAKLLLIIGLSILLCSCSLFRSPKQEAKTYALAETPCDGVLPVRSHGEKILSVAAVTAAPGYDTENMMYSRRPYALNQYSKNRWIAPPADMLTPLLVGRLAHSGCFKAVVASPVAGTSDLTLNAQILILRQEYFTPCSQERLAVQVTLTDSSSSAVIAQKRFESVVSTPQNTPYGGVIAANRAVAAVLSDIAGFVCHYH
ncbi:MAG: ABC-type transport auxiliary lipoprotein family protein [Gammaproteobacteria bacterium]